MKKFCEFLDEKAKVTTVADYDGVLATKPPADGKYDGVKSTKEAKLPYKGKGEDKGLVSADTDDKPGFGDVPHPNMAPEKVMPMGEKPKKAVKHIKAGGKLKEFTDATNELNPAEFVSYMRESFVNVPDEMKLHSENGEVVNPHPHEVIAYTVAMMHNPRIVSRLVSEVSRQGKLSEFVYELLRHPDFAKELANTNEAVTPSIIDDEKTDGKGVIPQPEDKMKKPVEKMMKKK